MTWLEEYRPLNGVRLNMVANKQGDFVGPNGSSREISNSLDRELLLRLRQLSDIFVTGGNTFRTEGYKVPSKRMLAVISSKPDDLPKGVLAITPESSNLAQNSIGQLRRLGFERILLEVGPSLAELFLKSDCVDEFCLTIPGGTREDSLRVLSSLGSKLELIHQTRIDETLFTRWRRGNESP